MTKLKDKMERNRPKKELVRCKFIVKVLFTLIKENSGIENRRDRKDNKKGKELRSPRILKSVRQSHDHKINADLF